MTLPDGEDDWERAAGFLIPGLRWRRPFFKRGRVHLEARHDGKRWELTMNDFPSEALYSLIVGGKRILDFNDWPSVWRKPKGR